ncbi:MAG TPA: hypothetical protein VFV38_16785 [Ktedonobacteraceae bacterium]|nr:hypothetical protein [Ktedonobacteraceae bacterium]
MTKTSDFTPEESELLFDVPFIVAGTSLAIIRVNPFKAVTTALSFYAIVRDTSRQFSDDECIQSIFAHKDQAENVIGQQSAHTKEEASALRDRVCEQALRILSEKAQQQEVEHYKRWLLQIASETMQKAHSNGLLGLGHARAETQIAQALQDFRQVLHLEA